MQRATAICAIVLQGASPQGRTLKVLISERGAIQVAVADERIIVRLRPGTLIEAILKETAWGLRLEEVLLFDMPLALARYNILFLHHLLELVLFFVPQEQAAPEIFNLVALIYKEEYCMLTLLQKKLFVVKFFTLVGMYPENEGLNGADFYRLISAPVGVMLKEQVCQRDHEFLDYFLLQCIAMHPYKERFKTVYLYG